MALGDVGLGESLQSMYGRLAMGTVYGIGAAGGSLVQRLLTRKRHRFLYSLAEELVELLELRGVKRDEGCELRALVEKLWDLKKDEEPK